MSTTANKIISSVRSNASDQELYLDTAAELSKLDRKNHWQVSSKGVPLVYDLMVTISTPNVSFASTPDKELLSSGLIYTVPQNWQTRNAVRMTHFERENLRREAGVKKGSIGKYAKNMRFNMDSEMFGVTYNPSGTLAAIAPATQRIYSMYDIQRVGHPAPSSNIPGQVFTGGVWDYTQLAQVESGDANVADPFFLNVCGDHSASAPGNYTYIGVILAYNQRRQTVQDDATLTSGGDTQFINDDSPFFRIPEQDVSEDKYVEITLDEQDNPPYDRSVTGGAISAQSDALLAQPVESFQMTIQKNTETFRVQAPLGLLRISLSDMLGSNASSAPVNEQYTTFEIECLGTYEM